MKVAAVCSPPKVSNHSMIESLPPQRTANEKDKRAAQERILYTEIKIHASQVPGCR